jgi:aldehyde dehydrogenase (NAD+)
MLALAELYAEAGFPPGVVQFLSGAASTGALLSSHMQISKISITGSLGAGIKVQEQATKSNLKKVTLELGGKSPAIVFDDADIPTAVGGCSFGFLFNTGQVCAAASRVYVQESIAPKFIEAIKEAFKVSIDGLGSNPAEKTTQLGPVADQQQYDRVMSFIEEGKASAELIVGGSRKGTRGCFIEPTIFLNPRPGSTIYKDEIFGPVLVVKTFKTEEDVITMANNTTYGLAGMLSGLSPAP